MRFYNFIHFRYLLQTLNHTLTTESIESIRSSLLYCSNDGFKKYFPTDKSSLKLPFSGDAAKLEYLVIYGTCAGGGNWGFRNVHIDKIETETDVFIYIGDEATRDIRIKALQLQ